MAAALLFALGASARGAVLVTPNNEPSAGGGNYLVCYLTNVSENLLWVQVEILDIYGGVVSDTGEVAVQPFVRFAVFESAGSGPTLCRFTVKGSKRSVRTSSCVYEEGVGCTATVEGS
jgi:hypothetical protein